MINGKNRYYSDLKKFDQNMFERSETIFEGGDEDEVQVDE
jgi:hypothetical protein